MAHGNSPEQLILRGQTLRFSGNPFVTAPEETLRYDTDGAVLIENGHITAVGPARAIIEGHKDAPVTSYGDGLIMAGFVDCHMHYPQTDIIASYGEKLLKWLETYTYPQEMRFGDKDVADRAAAFFLDQCLSNGTTTACVYGTVHAQSATSFFEASAARGLRMAAGKVCMDRNAPEGLRDSAQSAYDSSKALIQEWHGRDRCLYAITPRFAPTSSPEQLEALGALWREHPGALMQTHLSEMPEEIAWVRALFPGHKDYFAVYEDFGLTGPGALFGHAIYLSGRERAALAASGSAIIHCPTSNAFMGSGAFDIGATLQASPPPVLGLGSDVGAGTSLSMFSTMRAAYEAAQLNGYGLHPARAFWLATAGGAKAMGLNDKIGALEPGIEADIIVLDLHSTPMIKTRVARADALSDVLFAQMIMADDRAIRATYAGGRKVFERPGL